MNEELLSQFCDNYCRHLEEYLSMYEDPDEATERMEIEQCENCPLVKLMMEVQKKNEKV